MLNSKMKLNICSVVLFCVLMSRALSNFLSVSQHGPHVSIAKSYVVPMKLTCEDHLTRTINISGISLFKSKRTVAANHVFPGIHSQSLAECQQTFHPVNGSHLPECLLSFAGRKIPPDVMFVAVYRCITTADPQKQMVHTRASESGDVVLRCGIDDMIDILDIKLNRTDLNNDDKELTKQLCAMKMFQTPQQAKRPVFCTVSREGKKGELSVKYQCLRAQQKVSGQDSKYTTGMGLVTRRQARPVSLLHKHRKHNKA